MTENQVAKLVLDAAFKVHKTLGPGLLESVYEKALCYELEKLGLTVDCQVPIPVFYDAMKFDQGFRADVIVDGRVLIEVKSLDLAPAVAYKVLLSYLTFSGIRLGLLINFGEEYLKNGIKRVVNRLPEEQ